MPLFRSAPVAKAWLLGACFAAAGCHFNSTYNNSPEDKDDAEKITERFYILVQDSNYAGVHRLFSPKFFAATDTAKLDNILQASDQKLGAVEKPVLGDWQSQVTHGTDAKSEYVLRYRVKRKKFDSEETFTLLKENGQVKIVGYTVNSDGFFEPDSSRKSL